MVNESEERMSYDDEVRKVALGMAVSTNAQNRLEALRAIPNGALKINNQFVDVASWLQSLGITAEVINAWAEIFSDYGFEDSHEVARTLEKAIRSVT